LILVQLGHGYSLKSANQEIALSKTKSSLSQSHHLSRPMRKVDSSCSMEKELSLDILLKIKHASAKIIKIVSKS